MRVIYCLVLIACFGAAQEPTPTVAEFFQQRLNGAPVPPSADALLAVMDPILQSDPHAITAALPLIDAALTSDKEELPGEAVLALFMISRRSDNSRIPEIEALLARPEEPLRNGAVLVLQTLTPLAPDLTAPVMIRFLNSSAKPSAAKSRQSGRCSSTEGRIPPRSRPSSISSLCRPSRISVWPCYRR